MKGIGGVVTLVTIGASVVVANLDQKRSSHRRMARRLSANETNDFFAQAKRDGSVHETSGTFYLMPPGSLGACGGSLSPNGYTVALAQPMYGDLNSVSQYCGQTITIQANGKMHTATIEDACPTGRGNCGGADLDMSQALFNFFADPGAGKIGITWTFGDLVSQQAASSRSKAASIASKSKASSVSASKSKAAASKSSAALASKSAASLASAAAATGSAAAAQITSAAGYAAGSGAFGSLDEINAGFVKMANNAH